MRSQRAWVGGVLVVMAALLVTSSAGCVYVAGLGLGPSPLKEHVVQESPAWFESNRIALIEVDGVISLEPGLFSWNNTSVNDIQERLERIRRDRSVRAVVLRVNSPGGEVTASDIIYREILKLRRETGKPVVACIMSVGASGAYYVSLASDEIVCQPTAITGSVGVIMSYTNIEGLYQKLGLKAENITSGPMKDMGSPTRPLRDDERAILKNMNQDLFNRFGALVRERRPGVTDADFETIRSGRVFDAKQAHALHLVDRVGGLSEAIAEAQRLAGISSANVIMYRRGPLSGPTIYSGSRGESSDMHLLVGEALRLFAQARGPGFFYLWQPGVEGTR